MTQQLRYMLDTDTASYIIKGNASAVKHLLKVPMHEICISVITEAELLFGVACRPDIAGLQNLVQEFLVRLDVLAWTSDAAARYAQLRALLERKGKTMGNMDLLIASHALSANVTLVTNDQAFRSVHGLSCVNWCRN